MLIISHRINTIDLLKTTPQNFGVEIDIRSFGEELIVNHDPFERGENLLNWIEFYNHKFLILNVKEEGLEDKLLSLMKLHNINNYFFLDQSFPFLMKTINSGVKKVALRLSEYESIDTILNLSGKVEWVWVDFFNKFPLSIEKIIQLKENKYRICLVSPELQGHNPEIEIPKMKEFLGDNIKSIDAVCTKRSELWKLND